MTLTQRLLEQNGIKPAATADNNGTGEGQQGSNGGNAGGEGGGTNSDGKPDLAGNEGTKDTGNAGGGSPESGNDAGSSSNSPIDMATILKGLEEQGIKVTDLEELRARTAEKVELTQEQKDKAEQQRKNAIRSHALTTGKVTTTVLDQFARESAAPVTDLAYTIFKKDKLAERASAGEAEPTEQELRDEFDEVNFQFAEADDPKRKIAEKRLRNEVEGYLQQTYPDIYNMEDEYTQHETTQNLRRSYDATVDDALAALGTAITFEINEDKNAINYPVTFTPEQVGEIKALYKAEAMFGAIGKSNIDKANMAEAMKNSFIAKFLPKILNDVAQAHASAKVDAMQKGRRNIFNTTNIVDNSGNKGETTPGVKKQLAANAQKK